MNRIETVDFYNNNHEDYGNYSGQIQEVLNIDLKKDSKHLLTLFQNKYSIEKDVHTP